MNARDAKPIHEALQADFPGFATHKRLFLRTPLNGMLRAVTFEPSAFSKDDFQVEAFAMPLCVPCDHISLLFSEQIPHPGGGWGWSLKAPDLVVMLREAIRLTALPFLDPIQSADAFVTLARRYWRNPHAPKEAAFVLAHAGQYQRAITIIDDLLPKLDLSSHWQKAIFEDSAALRHLLLHDKEMARLKLGMWEDFTIDKLKLAAFR